MDRLVSLEPMAETTDGTNRFPAHVIKECDDWDDEANDDSLYRADFSDLPEGAEDPSPLMWRDLFELNIALREASRIYTDPAIFSAIEKIERATSAPVQIEMASNEALLAQVERAIENHAQIKIEYPSGVSDEAHARAIEPREMKVLNGHTYVRAYCTTPRRLADVSRGSHQRGARHVTGPERVARRTSVPTGSPGWAKRATRSSWCVEAANSVAL